MEGAFLCQFLVWETQMSNRPGVEEVMVPLVMSANRIDGNKEGGSVIAIMLPSFLAFSVHALLA